MAVLGYREILPRTYEHRLGDSPTASIVYAATVDEPTPTSVVLDAIGISHGSIHPDYSSLECDGISVDEPDRHHVTITYSYTLKKSEDDDNNPDNPPWMQPDVWTFATSSGSVACTEHYPFNNPEGQNNLSRPLTNTAGDKIFGVTRAESELKITITGSRLRLNLKSIKKYHNTINSKDWAGFPKHTVQCIGISASPDRLEWQGQVLNFWRVGVELVYRSSSHNIFLPNVGWNVIVNGKKQRAWTYIEENGVRSKVPAPHPVALNADGGFLCGPGQEGSQCWDCGTTLTDDGTTYF